MEPAKDEQIKMAYEAQGLMRTSHDELVDEVRAEREGVLAEAINTFESKLTHAGFRRQVVAEVNEQRFQNGLPHLNDQEAIEERKDEIESSILHGEIVIHNSISYALEISKNKGWLSSDANYDDMRLLLVKNEKEFCPEGNLSGKPKALRLKKVLKNILKK